MSAVPIAQEDQAKWEKIAALMAHRISYSEIAEIVGLSEGRISQLQADPHFAAILERKRNEIFARQQEIADGWDAVESKAVAGLQEVLRYNKSPDFLLKAAMVANKAQRPRPASTHNQPIDPGKYGQRVVVQLNANFVQKLQNVQLPAERTGTREAAMLEQRPDPVSVIEPGPETAGNVAQLPAPVSNNSLHAFEGVRKRTDFVPQGRVEAILGVGTHSAEGKAAQLVDNLFEGVGVLVG